MKVSLKRDLEARAQTLRNRLEEEETQKTQLRTSGRHAIELADSILQSVEQSLEHDGSLTARQPQQRSANMLPPLLRPDTAEK